MNYAHLMTIGFILDVPLLLEKFTLEVTGEYYFLFLHNFRLEIYNTSLVENKEEEQSAQFTLNHQEKLSDIAYLN